MFYARCPTCKIDLAKRQLHYDNKKKELQESGKSDEAKQKEMTEFLKTLNIRACCIMRLISLPDY